MAENIEVVVGRGGGDGLLHPLAEGINFKRDRRRADGHRLEPVAPAEGVGQRPAADERPVVGQHVARGAVSEVPRARAVGVRGQQVRAGGHRRRIRRRARNACGPVAVVIVSVSTRTVSAGCGVQAVQGINRVGLISARRQACR